MSFIGASAAVTNAQRKQRDNASRQGNHSYSYSYSYNQRYDHPNRRNWNSQYLPKQWYSQPFDDNVIRCKHCERRGRCALYCRSRSHNDVPARANIADEIISQRPPRASKKSSQQFPRIIDSKASQMSPKQLPRLVDSRASNRLTIDALFCCGKRSLLD
ncbi:hypothetical protein ACFE04_010880 [Oxalis oulophora]